MGAEASSTGPYILAIDLGTSGPKVALVTCRGEVLSSEFEPVELLLLPGGGAEQRPDDWWGAITTAAKRLLGKKLVPADEIVAVSCTSQWSGTVALDENGNTLMNAIIWMDSRGAPQAQKLAGGLISIEGYGLAKIYKWIKLTGGAPSRSGKDPIAHILYIRDELPEIYERTKTFLEPKDFLNYLLTGKIAASYDSITLHWVTDNRDINKIVYDDGLLRMAQLDREKLPELKRAIDVLGPLKKEIADELGLSHQVQVVMGTPDVHSAAIGSGATRDYEAHLYIGTSSWIVCHVPFKKTDLFHSIASLPAAIPQRYMAVGEQETAGACLNFLRDNVFCRKDELTPNGPPEDVYDVFCQLAERAPPGCDNVIFTPWLYGERTPIDDHTVRGGFFNLSLNHKREHMVRAVFEGVAFNARWSLGYMEKFVGRELNPIKMIGGGAKSEFWCQIFADILGRTICQVEGPIDANVRGAALIAAVGLGHTTFDEVSHAVKIRKTFEPNQDNRQTYDRLFTEFVNIYKSNKAIYARLNASQH